MQYIFGILLLLLAGVYVSKKVFGRKPKKDSLKIQKKVIDINQFSYRGRKTEGDWKEWWNDVIEEQSKN